MATTQVGDAATLTDTILEELAKVGLNSDKILSQCYDGASVMSGKHGGVQKLLQDKLGRDIPYVHCFNHQLHLVVVHSLSAENAISDSLITVACCITSLESPLLLFITKGIP